VLLLYSRCGVESPLITFEYLESTLKLLSTLLLFLLLKSRHKAGCYTAENLVALTVVSISKTNTAFLDSLHLIETSISCAGFFEFSPSCYVL
jgi:hypothetical protein